MLIAHFRGWFQCRLATDPDPTDERRGVSGFTFALAGEPDFDRVIRFHKPVAPRTHGPRVGVFVDTVLVNGVLAGRHPLTGARVDLLDEPKFESRNYVLGPSSQGPIAPFHLQLTTDDITLAREDLLYPPDPTRELHDVPPEYLARRGSLIPMTVDRVKLADATGISDPLAYRKRRRELLVADLEETQDPVEATALKKRIAELSISEATRLQVATLTLYNDYRFDIHGPTRVHDAGDRLQGKIATDLDWSIAFWMGAWDSDTLCGYISGMVSIPLHDGSRDE